MKSIAEYYRHILDTAAKTILKHFDGTCYYNPHVKNDRRTLWDVILWQIGFYNDKTTKPKPPRDFVFPELEATSNKRSASKESAKESAQVSWINHSSFLIDCNGTTVLTDPIWARRASPLRFIGPKRRIKPGIPLKELKPIDLILLSHNHYDHMDERAIRKIVKARPGVTVIVPLGVGQWFRKRKIGSVYELDWWQQHVIPTKEGTVVVTAVPAQHFSGRGIFDRNCSLWCGYIIDFWQEGKLYRRAYFAGDTGYNEIDFRQIGKLFGPVDLALLPIGTYVPRTFMKPVHSSPDDAIKIHADVKSKLSVGCHFGTFRLSDEPIRRPPYDLYLALKKGDIDLNKFQVPRPGIPIHW